MGLCRAGAEDAEPQALQRLLPVGLSRAGAEDAEPQEWRRLHLVGPSLVLLEDAALPLQPDVAEAGALQQVDAADGLVGQADRVATAPSEFVGIECVKKGARGLVDVKMRMSVIETDCRLTQKCTVIDFPLNDEKLLKGAVMIIN